MFGSTYFLLGAVSLVFVLEGSFSTWVGKWVNDWVGFAMAGSFFVAGIACISAFAAMQRRAKATAKQMQLFDSYLALIGNEKSIPLQWLAQKKNISQEQVETDLALAMSRGFFANGHIDRRMGTLLFPNTNVAGTTKRLLCQGCGAGIESITGITTRCPYCQAVVDG